MLFYPEIFQSCYWWGKKKKTTTWDGGIFNKGRTNPTKSHFLHCNCHWKREKNATKMYILVVFKNKNLCNIVINTDIILIICKVFYSVIGFKTMLLCLPVRYCTYRRGGMEGVCHWLVLTGCHMLLSASISLLLTVCMWLNVHTVGQCAPVSLQCIAEMSTFRSLSGIFAPLIDQISPFFCFTSLRVQVIHLYLHVT